MAFLGGSQTSLESKAVSNVFLFQKPLEAMPHTHGKEEFIFVVILIIPFMLGLSPHFLKILFQSRNLLNTKQPSS